ncbi:putative integral membrane protein [Clavispora lusitaniae]|uniref:putative integral membrane protein n=1 Tax=Clavispora lusitaniae TaxID=36911 RepID=UPI00202C2AFE|nr:putative integral membrane protein [Clavispora lusitaniae]
METRLNSENKTKGEAFASQNTHKDFATDLDSDGYSILPKTSGVYNFYSVNDFLAGLLVFSPSIVAASAVEANQQRDWAITLSKLTVLAQVAWMVIFITSWPSAWIRHLEKSRLHLLNYINSVFLGTNAGSQIPEVALNRRVFAVNLLLALKLQRYEKLALLLWFCAIVASPVMMRWSVTASGNGKHSVRDANIIMFVFWQGSKLLIQASVILQKSGGSPLTTGTAPGVVTDANLSYYVESFCGPQHMFESPPSVDAYKDSCFKVDLACDAFGSDKSTLGNSRSGNEVSPKEKADSNKGMTVPVVPFPFDASPLATEECDQTKTRNTSGLPKVPNSPVVPNLPRIPNLKDAVPVSVSPHGSGAFSSRYETRFSLRENSEGCFSENFIRRPHVKKQKKFHENTHLHESIPYGEEPSRMGHWKFTSEHRNQDITISSPTKSKPIEAIHNLNRESTQKKDRLFEKCWALWTQLLSFDINKGLIGAVYHSVYTPAKSVAKMIFVVFVSIPLNVSWVIFCLFSFVPRVLIKIFVVAPISIVADYKKDSEYKSYKEYRATHEIPVFKENASTTIANKLLERINRADSKDYVSAYQR